MANRASLFFDKPRIGLRWLIRLRWMAAVGQIATCTVAYFLLQLSLPLALLAGCIGVTLVTNLFMESIHDRIRNFSTLACAFLLVLDTLTLTLMLYGTGGITNPFSTFYLLHLTIAVILLPPLAAWLIVALCAVTQGVLFIPHQTMEINFPPGAWIAMVLTAVFIAFFVGKLSRELVEARRQAARSESFESLATLAAGIAHELATPLGTIAVVSADLGQSNSPADTLADAKLIRSEVERCRAILETLSDQATRGIGDLDKPVRMGDLPALLAPYLKVEQVPRIRWEIGNRSAVLLVPETVLLQSLAVLVKNACEASRPDQSVTMSIQESATEMEFSVRDEGLGMPPEIAARVGEPFFTTKEPGVGMGLGLFLVRTFVERVRGRLDIQSNPGKGTVIHLSIPRKKALAS